jgi:NADH dehydrogenase FAD-containing subunit
MAQKRVVIVGAGFGGLAAAKALGKTPAQIILNRPHKSPPVSAPAIPSGNGGTHS